MTDNKRDILSLNLDDLKTEVEALSQPKFKAGQIFDWLHNKQVCDFDEMTNLSKDFRQRLGEEFEIRSVSIEKKFCSKIDNTRKYLFRLFDGEFVEGVVMQYKYGYSVCVSTQVGCNMGCKFCASTLDGCVRSLSAGEIISQVYTAQRDVGQRISHVVLMGMGEPLDNYENVCKFLSLVTDEKGQNLSIRHISLSTCGIVDKIYDLAEKNLGITLSISLHAPTDEIRTKMMPINKKWNTEQLLEACRVYTQKTGRRISFEYAMVDGVNDTDECASILGQRLKGMLCHVNLIPVNEVKETGMKKSDRKRQERFMSILEQHGITVTVRRTLGSDINASCGQLRRANTKKV